MSGDFVTTLSVAVPAHNEQSNLTECLDHLLDQTRPIDEVIVVDNGSTDATPRIVDEYAAHDRRVRRVVEPKPGVHAARRRGLDEAASDLVAKVDADTHVGRDWAQIVVEFFSSSRGSDFSALTGPFLMWDAPAYSLQKRLFERSFRRIDQEDLVTSIHGPAYVLRRETWQTIRDHLHDDEPGVWEDLDISLAMKKKGLHTALEPRLLADSSCRRLRVSPWRNLHYMMGGRTTARAHGDRELTRSMTADLPIRVLTHVYFWALLRPWDNTSRTWRPHRYFTRLSGF
ncbi:glycosyltransferase family 2 protein [Gordonia polyisoprenivorans]|nr:glycosyltransferase family 2 protein [Gordonia polyisoprenivorans]